MSISRNRKIRNRLFAIAILLPSAFLCLYFFNNNLHNALAKTLFQWHKKTVHVEARVLGWGFSAHRSGRNRSSFSYDYGVAYFFKRHKYVATVNIVSHTRDKNGEKYYQPLPQNISLLINTAMPQQYLYEHKKETGNIVLCILFSGVIVASVYSIVRPETSFYFKNPHKGFSARTNNIILNILALAPFVLCYFMIKNAHEGNEAELADGYEIISSRTPYASGMSSNITTYNNKTAAYISFEMDKRYLQYKDTIAASSHPGFGEYYKLPVEKTEHSSSIRISIYKVPEWSQWHKVYILTAKGKYIATPYLYH